MQQPKGTAKFQRAHHFNKLKYIGMKTVSLFLEWNWFSCRLNAWLNPLDQA